MRENQWGDGIELKGQRTSWEGTIEMKTGLKNWVGLHDGKESGKNMWSIKIKLKNKDWHTCERCMDCKNSFFFLKRPTLMLFYFLLRVLTCGGQLSPAFKLYWVRSGLISSPIRTNDVRMGQAQYPVWGQTNIRGEVEHACEELCCVQERWSPRNFCPRYLVNLLIAQSNAWDKPYSKVKGKISNKG